MTETFDAGDVRIASDDVIGDHAPLVDAVPGAETVVVPDRDHLTTVGDDRHEAAVLDFLAREGLSVGAAGTGRGARG